MSAKIVDGWEKPAIKKQKEAAGRRFLRKQMSNFKRYALLRSGSREPNGAGAAHRHSTLQVVLSNNGSIYFDDPAVSAECNGIGKCDLITFHAYTL